MLLPTVFFFGLGAIVASFVGVVVERVNTGSTWVAGRSRCDSCNRELTARDLVPIASWFLSGGKCRACGSRISGRSTLAELALGLLFALGYRSLGFSLLLPVFLLALALLLAVVLYDLRHMFVPRAFYLPLVALALLFAYLAAPAPQALGAALLVAALIGLAFFLLFALSGGRMMGLGDTPVAFALALLSGPRALSGLVFSFWIGAIVGIALLVLVPGNRRMGVEVPFVPFLAAGFLLAYFCTWDPFSITGLSLLW
jgi:leader peptidase (prepilin peptidase)/N-methyltransferase